MVIKTVIIKENGKPIKCVELVEFQDANQFTQMAKLCEKNYQDLKQEEVKKENSVNDKFRELNDKLAKIEEKVENNTKLIMGETEDEEEND